MNKKKDEKFRTSILRSSMSLMWGWALELGKSLQ